MNEFRFQRNIFLYSMKKHAKATVLNNMNESFVSNRSQLESNKIFVENSKKLANIGDIHILWETFEIFNHRKFLVKFIYPKWDKIHIYGLINRADFNAKVGGAYWRIWPFQDYCDTDVLGAANVTSELYSNKISIVFDVKMQKDVVFAPLSLNASTAYMLPV